MTMRTKITISVIAVMCGSFALGRVNGFWAVINTLALLVNCWFLGGYIKDVTRLRFLEDIPWNSYREYYEEDGTLVIEANYYPEEEGTDGPTD